MHALLVALGFLFPSPAVAAVAAGDSVIVTLALVDNATPQPVSVDSVRFSVVLTPLANSTQTLTVAKQAGVTTGRFAYPLSLWAPNQTLGGPVSVYLGHNGAGCAPSACWSNVYTKGTSGSWAWGYLLDATKPNPAEASAFTVQSVGLN